MNTTVRNGRALAPKFTGNRATRTVDRLSSFHMTLQLLTILCLVFLIASIAAVIALAVLYYAVQDASLHGMEAGPVRSLSEGAMDVVRQLVPFMLGALGGCIGLTIARQLLLDRMAAANRAVASSLVNSREEAKLQRKE
jgi:uncharacterized membrane protein